MTESLLAARVSKVACKASWSMLAELRKADKNNVHTLHTRDVGLGADNLEFVKKYTGSCFIEPNNGYLISANGYLLEESLYTSYPLRKPIWKEVSASPLAFFAARRNPKRIIRVPKAISLRHLFEWNYYHFFNDVLGKINIFDEMGLDPAIPLVIGRYYYDVPFVRQIIHRGELGKRNWIIPTNEYVQADEIYYCRTKQGRVQMLDTLAEKIGVPVPSVPQGRRIFLTRPKSGIRHIINDEEIGEVLTKYGFETVDFEKCSVDEQIETLNKTRHLIAIHGAGMTNIIFRRRAPMTVLALRSPKYSSVVYMQIAQEFGYRYTVLRGHSPVGKPAQHSSFKVDPDALEKCILEALATDEDFIER